MKRLLIAALLCAGCATAPKEPEQRLPEVGTAADDATLVQAFVQQQQAQSDALFHPAAGGRKVDCGQECQLAGNICSLSGRICAITARHDGDAELERDCNDALDRCSRARAVLHADNCGCSAD